MPSAYYCACYFIPLDPDVAVNESPDRSRMVQRGVLGDCRYHLEYVDGVLDKSRSWFDCYTKLEAYCERISASLKKSYPNGVDTEYSLRITSLAAAEA